MLISMTKIGYGSFYIKQINNEVAEARRSIAHKRHTTETLLANKRAVERPERSKFKVIEGGTRLGVSDIKQALDEFRRATGAQINRAPFSNLWGVYDEDSVFFLLKDEIDGLTKDHLRDDPAGNEDRAKRQARRESIDKYAEAAWDQCLFKTVAKRAAESLMWPHLDLVRKQMETGGRVRSGESRESLRKKMEEIQKQTGSLETRLRLSNRVLAKNNPELEERLNAAISSSNIFEVTNRRYIYLFPENVEEFVPVVSEIVKAISYDGLWGEIAKGNEPSLNAVKFTNRELLSALRGELEVEVLAKVRTAAELNAADATKLRAFVAGETLADILLSQVFLTPRVREAAVRTLNNLVTNSPMPDGGPPRAGSALRARGRG
jgi:hypothetical protein